MRRRRKSMALRAMVFLFLLMGTVIWNGCGNDAYEAVDTIQTASVSKDNAEDSGSSGSSQTLSENGTKSVSGSIVIYICGAVRSPGVYELPERARVYEAIQAAGGLTEDADSIHTNQAKILSDGEQITILTVEEAKTASNINAEGTATTGDGNAGNSPVNINTAGVAELTTLSGIGESRANDIISYREEHGPFQKTEDIMKVSGIKTALYSKIKDHICV